MSIDSTTSSSGFGRRASWIPKTTTVMVAPPEDAELPKLFFAEVPEA